MTGLLVALLGVCPPSFPPLPSPRPSQRALRVAVAAVGGGVECPGPAVPPPCPAGLSLVIGDLLPADPLVCSFGIFLYMGVTSLNGSSSMSCCTCCSCHSKHHPDAHLMAKKVRPG